MGLELRKNCTKKSKDYFRYDVTKLQKLDVSNVYYFGRKGIIGIHRLKFPLKTNY